jgi:uncharacterized membrane protein
MKARAHVSRGVRRTALGLVALALMLVFTAPAPVSAGGATARQTVDGRYEVIVTELELPVPDLPDTELEVDVEDINNRGQVVGTLGPWWHKQTLLWEADGQITDLGASETGPRPNINDRGQVATELDGRLVLWRNGEVTDLGDATNASIRDVNERGQALVVRAPSTTDWSVSLWHRGTFTDVITSAEVPGMQLGDQIVLSDAGHVAGSVRGPECMGLCERPFVWHDGTRTDLDYNGTVIDINSSGQTIGNELAGFDDWHVVTTVDGETVRLSAPGATYGAAARDINDRGQIVGSILTTEGLYPVMWDDGEMVHLNDGSLPPGSDALAINERSQVLIPAREAGLFLWDDGELIHLPGSWGYQWPVLNDRGQVAFGEEEPTLWTVRRRR